ncbi:hypothetical protein CCACVL1_27339, partial [Corchorus capsularis]
DDPHLWRYGSDQVIRRCIPDEDIQSVLKFCPQMQVEELKPRS